jgi:hypothetical protein
MGAMMQGQHNLCLVAGETHNHPACIVAEHLLLEAAKDHGIHTLVAEASPGEYAKYEEALAQAQVTTPLYCTLPYKDHEAFTAATSHANRLYLLRHAKECGIQAVESDVPQAQKEEILRKYQVGIEQGQKYQQEFTQALALQCQYQAMPPDELLRHGLAVKQVLQDMKQLQDSYALLTKEMHANHHAAIARNPSFIAGLAEHTPCIGIFGSNHLQGIMQHDPEWIPLYLQAARAASATAASSVPERAYAVALPAANRIALPAEWNDLRPEDIYMIVETVRFELQQQRQQGQGVELPLSQELRAQAIEAVQSVRALAANQDAAPPIDKTVAAKKASHCVVM